MEKFLNATKAILSSRKGQAFLGTVITTIALHFGWAVPPEILGYILLAMAVFVGAISFEDAFKQITEGKKVEADATVTQSANMLRASELQKETAQIRLAIADKPKPLSDMDVLAAAEQKWGKDGLRNKTLGEIFGNQNA